MVVVDVVTHIINVENTIYVGVVIIAVVVVDNGIFFIVEYVGVALVEISRIQNNVVLMVAVVVVATIYNNY